MPDLTTFPDTLSADLDLDQLLARAVGHCQGDLGRERLRTRGCTTDLDETTRRLDATAEWVLMRTDLKPPGGGWYDPAGDWLDRLEIEGYVPEEEDVHHLRHLLRTREAVASFVAKHAEELPVWTSMVAAAPYDAACARAIDAVLDDEGHVRPDASGELTRIDKQMNDLEGGIRSTFQAALSRARAADRLDETEESVRNQRRVLAVRSEHKRAVQGVVHDQSESGRITYIEPGETVRLNNQRTELELDRRREVRRILQALAADLNTHRDMVRATHDLLAEVDACRAAAKLALEMDAVRPQLSTEPEIDLIEARHPYLVLHNRAEGKETVPLSVGLGDEIRVIAISGPNAGGKTIAMKTVGLIHLMVRHGFLVPCDERSVIGLFTTVLADLGDHQSIDDELSTYSAHLHRMRTFLETADGATLFLIDELGSGTDPALGGAMAEAVLRSLLETGARGMVTTHFGSIKRLAERDDRLRNASMVFDEAALAPTFRFHPGEPGSSYTFEIAARSGLPDLLVRMAREIAAQDDVAYDDLLQTLKAERARLEEQEATIRRQDKELKDVIRRFERTNAELAAERERMEAERQRIESDRERIVQEKVRASLRDLDKAKGEDARQALLDELEEAKKDYRSRTKTTTSDDWQEGADVYVPSLDKYGELVEEKGGNVILNVNGQRTTLPKAFVQMRERPETETSAPTRHDTSKARRRFDVETEFDLRGVSADDARRLMMQYIDQSLLNDVDAIRIIHGHGTGRVKQAVRRVAKDYDHVIAEVASEGENDGVTRIRFR